MNRHGPLSRYVKLWFAHAPGMLGTFSPPPRVSDPDMHHGTCVKHVPWCMPGSRNIFFLWSRWRGKRSCHSRHMRNAQFYVSDKRSMNLYIPNHSITQLITNPVHNSWDIPMILSIHLWLKARLDIFLFLADTLVANWEQYNLPVACIFYLIMHS